MLSSNGDPWFEDLVRAYGTTAAKVLSGLEIDNYLPGAGEVKLAVDLWGFSNTAHNLRLDIGEETVSETTFSGFSPLILEGSVPPSAVQNGDNPITVTLNGEVGINNTVMIDKWRLTYPRRTVARDGRLSFSAAGLHIAVSGLPADSAVSIYRQLAGGATEWLAPAYDSEMRIMIDGLAEAATYHVASQSALAKPALRLPVVQEDLTSGEGEYLIIAHPDFIDANMELLVQARKGQGYTVKTADVEAVYDTFGGGNFGATAIRDYIAWAAINLNTTMVLLVGSDCFDYHDNYGTHCISFMPSLYAATGPRVKLVPVDAKYVDLNDNNIPDLPIGRQIPRTTAEWAAIVAKTLAYAEHPNPGSSVFTADLREEHYDFSSDAEAMIERMPSAWQSNVTTAYMDDLGITDARTLLINEINSGKALVSFVGHSGSSDWTFDGLFKAGDVVEFLTNYGKASVITQWGCWNTFYASPREDSLSHEFMLNGDRGAVAMLGAVTLTEAANERMLATQLYERMFELDKPLGLAILEAKQAHAASRPGDLDVILGWNLLGDPALIMEQ